MTTATIVSASQVVTPYGARAPGWVEVVGDHITEVREGLPPGQSEVGHPASILTPGFVDTHVHGGGGASFSTEDPAEALRAVRTHRHPGTTTMFASLVTAPFHNLRRQVVALTALVRQGVLAGLHLEGPWLSPHFKGAHDRHALASLRLDDLGTLLDTAPGAIRMVTLAPLRDAVRAATLTPAATHGLFDVGALRAGRRADLVLLDQDLSMERVMRAGRRVREGGSP